MREKIKLLVATDLIFLLLLMLSGAFSGVLSTVIYVLAFIIPIVFAVFASKMNVKTADGVFPPRNLDIAVAGVFPTVMSVMVISECVAYLMGIFGKSQTVPLGDDILVALLLHALLPAVLEETLFRYIPLRLLAGENGRACVIVSALFFALSHHSLYSIPYALVAGIAFMTLDIISGSVIPSLVIHLLNNTLSVLLMFYSENTLLASVLPTAVAILACASLLYLLAIRRRVRGIVSERFSKKEKYRLSWEPLLLVIPTLIIAVTEVFN